MTRKLLRPRISVRRVYSDERTVHEAIASAVITYRRLHPNRTFERVKEPEYTEETEIKEVYR
jgi:hypothetical protein